MKRIYKYILSSTAALKKNGFSGINIMHKNTTKYLNKLV